ncbi:MAG: DUF433 domain-containing protein [Rhodocyclaceae bacterium]
MNDLIGRITLEPGKRGGRPCIRGMRITVYDVLGWLAAGMSEAEILADYPELDREDISGCLAFMSLRTAHLRRVLGGAGRFAAVRPELVEGRFWQSI